MTFIQILSMTVTGIVSMLLVFSILCIRRIKAMQSNLDSCEERIHDLNVSVGYGLNDIYLLQQQVSTKNAQIANLRRINQDQYINNLELQAQLHELTNNAQLLLDQHVDSGAAT